MKPIKRKTTNTIFKRPDCFDLPGTKYKYEDETPAIETCWQLSKEELEKLNICYGSGNCRKRIYPPRIAKRLIFWISIR